MPVECAGRARPSREGDDDRDPHSEARHGDDRGHVGPMVGRRRRPDRPGPADLSAGDGQGGDRDRRRRSPGCSGTSGTRGRPTRWARSSASSMTGLTPTTPERRAGPALRPAAARRRTYHGRTSDSVGRSGRPRRGEPWGRTRTRSGGRSAEYSQRCDDGRFDEWSDLFAEDARFVLVRSGHRGSEDSIRRYMMTAMMPAGGAGASTSRATPWSTIDGDSATATTDYLFVRADSRRPGHRRRRSLPRPAGPGRSPVAVPPSGRSPCSGAPDGGTRVT